MLPLKVNQAIVKELYRKDVYPVYFNEEQKKKLHWIRDLLKGINTSTQPPLLYVLAWYLDKIKNTPGNYLELGTFWGGTAKLTAEMMHEKSTLYCFDTFTGHPKKSEHDTGNIFNNGTFRSDYQIVKHNLRNYPNIKLIRGRFEDTIKKQEERKYKYAYLNCDLYVPTVKCLIYLRERLEPEHYVICEGYDQNPNIEKALNKMGKYYTIYMLCHTLALLQLKGGV